MTERKPDPPQEEDPLVELARIVSGRSSFGGEARPASPEPEPVEPNEPESAVDLESELLNELQASFAALSEPADEENETDVGPEAVEEPPPPPAPPSLERAPAPRATPRERTEPVPARPLRPAAPTEPLSRATPTLREKTPDRSVPPAVSEKPAAPARPEPRLPPRRPDTPARTETLPEEEPLALPRFLSEQTQESEPLEPPGSPIPSKQPPAAPIEPKRPAVPVATRRPRRETEGASDRPALRYKSRSADERDEPPRAREPLPPALPPFPEEGDEPPRTKRGLSRFAPQRAAAQIPLERESAPRPARRPPPSPAEEDPTVIAPPPPEPDFESGFSLGNLAGEEFAAEEELPPFPEDDLEGRRRGHGGRLLIVIGAILLVGIAGAGAAYFIGSDTGTSGPPPIITADNSPDKIVPEAPEPPDDGQSKLFQDRIDGVQADDTTLVTAEDQPVDEIPAADGGNDDSPISRVIIPAGPGFDSSTEGASGSGEQVVASGDTGTGEDIGPRKVRTVVVKPDGTIVSSEAVAEGAEGTPGGDQMADIGNPLGVSPEVPDGRTEMDDVLDGGVEIPVNTDPLNAATPEAIASAGLETPEAPAATAAEELRETVTSVETPVPAAPAPEPQAPEPPQAAEANTGGSSGAVDLSSGSQPTAVASLPSPGSGGVLVQVSAQRSEEAARTTYRALQQRYPNILGPFQAAIIRADLDSGTWYRVRIGPFSSSDATRLCEDLKAAGGDCLLAR